MDLHRAAQILAVIWIVVSIGMGWLPAFMLYLDLLGIRQSTRPMRIRTAVILVLIFSVSATAVGTWAFASPADIPRSVGEVLLGFALSALAPVIIRGMLARRHS